MFLTRRRQAIYFKLVETKNNISEVETANDIPEAE